MEAYFIGQSSIKTVQKKWAIHITHSNPSELLEWLPQEKVVHKKALHSYGAKANHP